MLNLILENKFIAFLIIAGIIILLVWYFGNKIGKSVPTTVVPVMDNPSSSDGSNNPLGLTDSSIKMIVDSAHKDASSYWTSFWGHKPEVYIPLTSLSDTDFMKAYDIWNNEYQKEDQKTMRGMIDGIWAWFTDGIAIGSVNNFTTVQSSLDDKFSRLNLA